MAHVSMGFCPVMVTQVIGAVASAGAGSQSVAGLLHAAVVQYPSTTMLFWMT